MGNTNKQNNMDRQMISTDSSQTKLSQTKTRTHAFWGYTVPPHDCPFYWFLLDPRWKEDKFKVTNLKNLPKFHFFLFWKILTYETHLLKLLGKMCIYEMDPVSIVEDTDTMKCFAEYPNILSFYLTWWLFILSLIITIYDVRLLAIRPIVP